MSTRRLAMITTVPLPVKKAFRDAPPPVSGEERLWRERAARLSLDSWGYSHLTVKPHDHNETVRYARRWFRGLFDTDSALDTFEAAGVRFEEAQAAVLSTEAIMFEPDDDDEGEDE